MRPFRALLSLVFLLAATSVLTAETPAIGAAAASTAGEEEDRILGLVLAHPVTRSQLIAAKAVKDRDGSKLGAPDQTLVLPVPGKQLIRWGKTDIVKYLLSKGADVNAVTTAGGATPLHYAAANGNADAIVALAIGIGANSAIFAIIESVLLKPLPYPHAEQLVDVGPIGVEIAEIESRQPV